MNKIILTILTILILTFPAIAQDEQPKQKMTITTLVSYDVEGNALREDIVIYDPNTETETTFMVKLTDSKSPGKLSYSKINLPPSELP